MSTTPPPEIQAFTTLLQELGFEVTVVSLGPTPSAAQSTQAPSTGCTHESWDEGIGHGCATCQQERDEHDRKMAKGLFASADAPAPSTPTSSANCICGRAGCSNVPPETMLSGGPIRCHEGCKGHSVSDVLALGLLARAAGLL